MKWIFWLIVAGMLFYLALLGMLLNTQEACTWR